MDRTALIKATAAGSVLQLAMVLAGHHWPAIRGLFAVGGTGFSLIAGLLFMYWTRSAAWSAALGGGAIAGGVCALIGIAVSVVLKDVPSALLITGTLSSVATGVLGGALGKLIFRR
jgi:hypothetical protein